MNALWQCPANIQFTTRRAEMMRLRRLSSARGQSKPCGAGRLDCGLSTVCKLLLLQCSEHTLNWVMSITVCHLTSVRSTVLTQAAEFTRYQKLQLVDKAWRLQRASRAWRDQYSVLIGITRTHTRQAQEIITDITGNRLKREVARTTSLSVTMACVSVSEPRQHR